MHRPTTARRLAGLVAAVAVSASTLIGLGATPASAAPSARAYETKFVSSINASRHAHDRKALTTNAHLTDVARSWARKMAKRADLQHNPHLVQDVGSFRVVGENVGVGGSEAGLHSAFMHSPGHRANILSKDYTQVGIGVAFGGGRTWVAEVFRKPAPAAKKPATSTKTLHLGSRGASVKRLQKILHVRPTGYFGPVTRTRLQAWQHAHHLKATGNLNRITRTKMHF